LKGKLKLIGGKSLESPKGLCARPTTSKVREAVINILQTELKNSHWLDICSGSGVMGCEAIQRGASRIVCIEFNKKIAAICRKNLISTAADSLESSHLEVICNEARKVLKEGCKKYSTKFIKKYSHIDPRFDSVYIDPPYEANLYKTILQNLLLGQWIKRDALVICECSKKLIPEIPLQWDIKEQRKYGSICLLFLTPNLALNSHADIDSRLQQISLEW